MTQKKQWQVFAAILGVGALGIWALIRWGGLASRAPEEPPQSVAITPQAPQRNTSTPQPAALPFDNNQGRGGLGTSGAASVPNFGVQSGGGAAPSNNQVARGMPANIASGGAAAVPSFGSGSQGGAVPFSSNNQVASAAPFNNAPAAGAAVPSFGTGGDGGNKPLAAGQNSQATGGLVPMFIQDPADPSAMAKHYLKQICGDRVPTLQDWQKLVEMKLPDADNWLHAPIGPGYFVMAMCLDLQNNLWVGTEGEGLYCFSAKDGMWTQFVATKNPPADGNPPIPASAVECGMGDNYVYALACDHQGRVWIGHLNHGISVFNGEKFQNYEVVGGLSRPDSLNGPLGERIFHIAVAPDFVAQGGNAGPAFNDSLTGKDTSVAGSVWMCTSAGISVYFPATDTWSYLTRAEGLPSDQANSVAFGADGTIFVATQCDGIAIASPRDCYKTWKQVAHRANGRQNGPMTDELPTTFSGTGLPCDLMNDILVAKDGTAYASTTAGITWSSDDGESWRFMRGRDYANKLRGRTDSSPSAGIADHRGVLSEDYSTALLEADEGAIYVGHRATSCDKIINYNVSNGGLAKIAVSHYVTSFAYLEGSSTIIQGTYGDGLILSVQSGQPIVSPVVNMAPDASPMPIAAESPFPENLEALAHKIKSQIQDDGLIAHYLGEEWTTQGDWMGRYGRQNAVLCAASAPLDHYLSLGVPKLLQGNPPMIGQGEPILVESRLGPLADLGDDVRHYLRGISTEDTRSLWDPYVGFRRQAEWDDHGESRAQYREGPDLCIRIKVPTGLFRVSMYFVNVNRAAEYDRQRDYFVELKPYEVDEAHTISTGSKLHFRVFQFSGGVYKQFVLRGPTDECCVVHRNYSLNTICSGIFVDKLAGEQLLTDDCGLPLMGGLLYHPAKTLKFDDHAGASLRSSVDAWSLIEGDSPQYAAGTKGDRPFGILAYRLAASQVAPELLEKWRWDLPLWNCQDRIDCHDVYLAAWHATLRINPQVARRPDVRQN